MSVRVGRGSASHQWTRTRGRLLSIALGSVGGLGLVLTGASAAHANYPDPPPKPGQIVPFGIEPVPSLCPDYVPAGTVMVNDIGGRDACDAAESLAPTPQAAAAIRYAFGKLGSEYSQSYRYSISPPMFDCSSLVSRAYDAADAIIRKGTSTYTWGRSGGLLTYTGAYMPAAYTGSNVSRVATFADMKPGDVIIQFEGTNPANSAGNNGHAQIYLGNNRVIQSGGWHEDSLVNVDRYRNSFNNAWFFRYDAAKAQDPVARKLATVGTMLGPAVAPPESVGDSAQITRHARGLLVSSPIVGVREVHGAILVHYTGLGREKSSLGLPTSDERAVGTARVSYFQGGAIYWAPEIGAVPVYSGMLTRYRDLGGPARSTLRLPVAAERDGAVAGTKVQNFQGGRMYWSAKTGGQEVFGAILVRYLVMGAETSSLGLPTSGELAGPMPGSRVSHFQNGSIWWSPATGPVITNGPIGAMYRGSGVGASIGLPTAPVRPAAVAGATVQDFQYGRVYHSAGTGAHEVYGSILARYDQSGAEAGPLGLPTSGEVNGPVAGSRMTTFQNGAIYWSAATGPVVVMSGPIGDRYRTPGMGAALGLPTAPEQAGVLPGTRIQSFQKGRIYWSASTGANEVYGGIFWFYNASGGERGAMGLPTSGELAGPVAGTRVAHFANGTVYWVPPTGTFVVWRSPIGELYRSGSMSQALGLPSSAERAVEGVTGGRVQEFARGRIYYSPDTGAHEIYGGILATYVALGAEGSKLGLPITGETAGPLPGTRMSTFRFGAIYWTGHAGFPMTGPIYERYRDDDLAPLIGMPTTAIVPAGVPDAWLMNFTEGRIYWSAATGAHEVYGRILQTYNEMGAEKSSLGLPTSGEYATATGRSADFEHGRIDFDGATGTTTVVPD